MASVTKNGREGNSMLIAGGFYNIGLCVGKKWFITHDFPILLSYFRPMPIIVVCFCISLDATEEWFSK